MMPEPDQSPFLDQQPMFPENRPAVMQEPPKPAMQAGPLGGVSQLIDSEIAGMVNSRIDLSKQWRRTRRIIWDKCWQHMKGIYDNANKKAWQSTTFMPLTSKVVEVIASNLHSAILGPEMPIEW